MPNENSTPLKSIPCNIITGFLGVGKTTAIQHLLKNKPSGERWAVLVNEFGEIGIDGGMLEITEADEITIKEVPGGCMCCTSGLPMRIALNMLLAKAKPHRLIIEPTGLGHPVEVLQTLQSEFYRDVISIQKTLTLVDPRNIGDKRYTENETYQQQLNVADIIIATKTDRCSENDVKRLQEFLAEQGLASKPFFAIQNGELHYSWLEGSTASNSTEKHHHHHHSSENTPLPMPGDDDFPECGYLHIENVTTDFTALGWLFDPKFTFDKAQLDTLLMGVDAERMKALFKTNVGDYAYNLAAGVLSDNEVNDLVDSRIEIITDDTTQFKPFENALKQCIQSSSGGS